MTVGATELTRKNPFFLLLFSVVNGQEKMPRTDEKKTREHNFCVFSEWPLCASAVGQDPPTI
jgi:hypothetical protein